MLNSFLDIIGSENINVEHMQNRARGQVAYTVIDLGSPITPALLERIRKVPHVRRVRVL